MAHEDGGTAQCQTPWTDVVRDLYSTEQELLKRVVKQVRDEYPTYTRVSDELLARSFRQNIDMCVSAVRGVEAPDESQLRAYAQISRRRLELGVPIDDLIRSYRFSIGLIADELTGLLVNHGGSPQEGIYAYRRIWVITDIYTALLAEVYRQHQLQLDTRNHELKTDLIERLRAGAVDEQALSAARLRFHLSADVHYRAFFARLVAESEHDLFALMVMLESQLIGRHGLGVIRGDTIVGVCARSFDVTPPLSIAYGHELPLEDIAASFDSAQRVASTSIARKPGNHYIEDAAWRMSVDPDGPVLKNFEDRFVAPLEVAHVNTSMILDSVQRYLLHNRSFRDAAVTLHCHQNTLRYRISRFEKLTGVRRDDTEVLVSLQWMFEAQARAER